MSFGARLQQARKSKGYSQDELANMIGTKGPAIGRYERDTIKPSIETAAKIAELLDVSLDWLVGHTDLELDKKMIRRNQEFTKMDAKSKEDVSSMLYADIKQSRMQSIL